LQLVVDSVLETEGRSSLHGQPESLDAALGYNVSTTQGGEHLSLYIGEGTRTIDGVTNTFSMSLRESSGQARLVPQVYGSGDNSFRGFSMAPRFRVVYWQLSQAPAGSAQPYEASVWNAATIPTVDVAGQMLDADVLPIGYGNASSDCFTWRVPSLTPATSQTFDGALITAWHRWKDDGSGPASNFSDYVPFQWGDTAAFASRARLIAEAVALMLPSRAGDIRFDNYSVWPDAGHWTIEQWVPTRGPYSNQGVWVHKAEWSDDFAYPAYPMTENDNSLSTWEPESFWSEGNGGVWSLSIDAPISREFNSEGHCVWSAQQEFLLSDTARLKLPMRRVIGNTEQMFAAWTVPQLRNIDSEIGSSVNRLNMCVAYTWPERLVLNKSIVTLSEDIGILSPGPRTILSMDVSNYEAASFMSPLTSGEVLGNANPFGYQRGMMNMNETLATISVQDNVCSMVFNAGKVITPTLGITNIGADPILTTIFTHGGWSRDGLFELHTDWPSF
jgi:hypothetical protein